uniref:Uncharacterized protein n=1 Tax=Tetradesmus obliquus TaxID=3088 RepID=A0A383VP91_TETOB
MDLASLVSNRPLLASLSREYELLKSTQADINYEEWIVQRLKLAAAQQQRSLSTGTAAVHAALPGAVAPEAEQQRGAGAATTEIGDGHHTALQERGVLLPNGVPGLGSVRSWPANLQQEAEGRQLQQPALQEWQAQDTTNLQQHQQDQQHQAGGQLKSQGSSKRPAPLWRQPGKQLGNNEQAAASRGAQPGWVAAAKLQSSLQSSKVVPVMHAAAERDRRLAATAALVREQMTLGSSTLPQPQAWQSRSLGSTALAQLHGLSTAADQQGQQQQPLLQQLVQQNQQLQQALQQQQVLLQGQEAVLQQAVPEAATLAHHREAAAAAATASTSANGSGLQQLPEAVQNSWLVKSILQPSRANAAGNSAASGLHAAPESILIAGEAGKRKNPQQQQQQRQEQSPEGMSGSDRRSQLKSALKQLLAPGNSSGQQQQQQQENVAGLLQELLRRRQQQVQQQHGKQQQQQQLLSKLESALQVLASKQRGSTMGRLRQSQDENLYPLDEQPEEEEQQPVNRARQALAERRQQQRQPSASSRGRPSSAVGPGGKQQRREKPAWQSEPFVAAPASLLRRKRSGVAEAWDEAAAVAAARQERQSTARPASARSPGKQRRPKPAASTPASAKRSSRKPAAAAARPQQHREEQQQRWQHDAADSAFANSCADEEFSFWNGQDATAANLSDAAADAAAVGAGSSSPPIRSALLAAARQKLPIRARAAAAAAVPGGWSGMSVQEVQGVQLAVQQQLQERQRHKEEGRLTRLEETASHILGVLGRLEEQLQQPAAAAAHASSSALLGRAAAAAAAAGSDLLQEPAVVSNVLSALDRIEAQEQEIRRRWFGSSSSEELAPEHPVQDAAAAEDAPAVTLSGIVTTAAGAVSTAGLDGTAAPQPPTALVVPAQAHAAGSSHHQQQQQQQPELLSAEALKSIRAGRRRFLKHQAMVDGSLEVLDSPPRQNTTTLFSSPEPGGDAARSSSRAARRRAKQQLQPTHVVEAVADLLLNELLFGQVDELDGFCEALCSQLFEEEFVEA